MSRMQMTPQEAREYVEGASDSEPSDAGDAYEWGALQAAKAVLAFLEQYPEARKLDAWEMGDALDAAEVKLPEGLTGFQFGYAVNMAKHILGEPPVANPAMMTVELPDA